MRRLLLSISFILFALAAFAQTEPAAYTSAVAKFKKFYNTNQPDSIYKMFGPEMKAALTQADFKNTTAQLIAQLGDLQQTTFTSYSAPTAVYKAAFKKGTVDLSIALNGTNQIVGLLLRPSATPQAATAATAAATPNEPAPTDPAVTEEPVTLKIMAGTLSGTLALPKKASGKVPVVLIIAGSGPTDRDGNDLQLGLNTNAYRMLSIALAKNGIASLRYDKRMVGKSVVVTKEKDLRIDDYVEDADQLINLLKDDQRFSKIIIFGHSEGSLIGMLAISNSENPVQGFISAAGAGEQADKILTEQMKSRPQYQQDAFKTMLDTLKKGKIYDQVDPAIYDIARPSVQRYLMSWCRFIPQKEIKKVKCPTLILQGTTDIQVGVDNADKLKKAKSDAQEDVIPGMNHILKDAPADKPANIATYKDPNLPLKPELVTAVVDFINKLK